jgi:hypothetical protein
LIFLTRDPPPGGAVEREWHTGPHRAGAGGRRAKKIGSLAIEEFVVAPQRRVIELRDLASSRTTSRAEKWAKRFGRTRR